MSDVTVPARVLRDGEQGVAVYEKLQTAKVTHACDGCRQGIPAGARYMRVQYVLEKPGEDLHNRHQARAVDYQRRVIMKYHEHCHKLIKEES